MTRRSARRAARGMSLLEVLIALLVFSFGLIGLVGLQARAINFSISAEDTNRAALLANEIAVEMLTKQGGVALDASRITAWKDRVGNASADGLPNGEGDIDVGPDGVATITIQWRSPKAASGTPNDKNRYVTQVKVVT